MNKAMKRSLLYTFILLLTALALTATGVYAWYTNIMAIRTSDATDGHANVGMRINLLFDRLDPAKFSNGSEITFPDGTTATFSSDADWGTPANPYIISLPRHMINLYALQESGYFYDRYITQNYEGGDPKTGEYRGTSIKPYFLVCETDATPACINGVRAGESITIKPVGNDEYPFIGAIGGAQVDGVATAPNGKTSISSIIANFTVEAPDDATDIGLFGKIGYLGEEPENAAEGQTFEGSISGVSDLLLYDVKIVSEAKTGARDEDHLWESDASNNVRYEEDHHVGILAGHIEYAAITNISVYYSSDSITAIDVNASGANYLSDSGIIGLVYNLNPETSGNSIGCATGTTIAGAAKGAGNEWGASIDMKTMFNRLRSVNDQTSSYSQAYVSAETVIIDEVEGTTTTTPTANTNYTTVQDNSNGTQTKYVHYYYSEDGGSFVFGDYANNSANKSQYAMFHGKSAHFFPKTVTTITKKNEFNDAWYIHDGSNYLSVNGTALSTAASEEAAAKWLFDASGHLYTNVETDTAIVKYYLNRTTTGGTTAGTLNLTTTASTVWNYSGSGDEFDSHLYTNVGGTNYYVQYNNGWALTSVGTYYYISDGAGHYLSGTANAVTNANSEADSVKWAISDPEGALTTISAYIGGAPRYLTVTNGALSMGNTAFTWNKDADGYYTTVQGVRYDLVYDNGWRVVPASGKKLTDGSGRWLTASTSGVDNASEADAVVWQFSSESGNTQIYTVLNGQKYYLTTNNDNALTVNTTAATWTRSGNSFYMTSGGKDYYLTYEGGEWTVKTLPYFMINDGAGNYLRVTGANAFANGNENNATHFYFTTENGANSRGTVYCVVGGTRYYLRNNDGEFETYNGNQTGAAYRTQWQNDGSSLYVTDGDTTYAIEYDTDAAEWQIKTIIGGKVITDGNGNYLRVTGAGSNQGTTNYDNTTDINEATRFTFSNDGSNSGYISATYNNGTVYLRNYNNGLVLTSRQNNRTNWNNNGTRIYYGNYSIGYFNNAWQLTNNTTVTSTVGHTISYTRNNTTYYLNATSSSSVGTGVSVSDLSDNGHTVWFSTNDATDYGSGDPPNGYIYTIINGTTYYLYRNSTSAFILSATNRTKWYNYDNNNLYERVTSGNTTYYNINYNYNSNAWNIVTGSSGYTELNLTAITETVTVTSQVEEIDTTRPTVYVAPEADPAPEVTVSDYSASGTDVTLSGPYEEDLTFTKTSEQTVTKAVTTEAGGHDTYFPLVAEDSAPFAVDQKNTGYVVGGSHASYQEASGDVRFSSYYTFNRNITGKPYFMQASVNGTTYESNNMEVLTRTYLSNGFKRVIDTYNERNTSYYNTISNYTRVDRNTLGLVKYDSARSQLDDMFMLQDNGTRRTSYNGSIYGVHFMDAAISMDNMITAPKVVINEQTYYNYQMPEDCIDFRLRTKGYVNFFAGTYYVNSGKENNCFFSLNQIFRNSNNEITAIKRIAKVYGVPGNEKKAYIYQYGDGTYSKGTSSPVGTDGYVEMFDTDWIERPQNIVECAMYYFEIPVNAGEYALGSVEKQGNESARYGAYLCYLDIGTSAADRTSMLGTIDFVYDNKADKIVVVPDTSENDTSLNYYVPSLAIMYTNNNDENDSVKIDNFTVKVTRTIGSVNDANATLNAKFGGSDAEHLDVIPQHSGGDTINKSTA